MPPAGDGNWYKRWPFVPIPYVDQVSIRWVGFLLPKFPEQTQFKVETNNYFKLWIDDQLMMDYSQTPCSGVCTAINIPMRVPLWTPTSRHYQLMDPIPQFHSIRIDYFISLGYDQTVQPTGIKLKWSSTNLPEEIVPRSNLFTCKFATGDSNPFSLVRVTHGQTDLSKTVVSGPTTAVSTGKFQTYTIQTKDSLGQDVLDDCYVSSFKAVFTLETDPTEMIEGYSAPFDEDNCQGLHQFSVVFSRPGRYRLLINEIKSGTFVIGIRTAISVTAIASEVATISSVTYSPSQPVAATTTTVYFGLFDYVGNEIDGSFLGSNLPDIALTIGWLYDGEGIVRLGTGFTDDAERLSTFGTSFSPNQGIVWDSSVRKFKSQLVIPISGRFQLLLRRVSNTAIQLLDEFDVIGNVNLFDASESVIIPPIRPFPPSSIVAGDTLIANVQLRDSNGNVLQSIPTSITAQDNPILISVYNIDPSVIVASAPCTPILGADGSFSCSVGPITKAVDKLFLTVKVANSFASMIADHSVDDASALAGYITGPYPITCYPSAIDIAGTVWSGVPRQIPVDTRYWTVMSFFDQYGNSITADLTSFASQITIRLVQPSTSQSVAVMDWTTYVYDKDSAVLKIPLISSVSSPESNLDQDYSGFELQLQIAGSPVNVFSTTQRIRIARGVIPQTSAITCVTDFASRVVDSPIMITCSGGGLGETQGSEKLWSVIAPTPLDPNPDPVTLDLVFALGQAAYIGSISRTVSNDYTITNYMHERGGLEARYFLNSDFTTVILPTSGVSPRLFTRIENILEMDFGEFMRVEGAIANSVEWKGYIDPPLSGINTYVLDVIASGSLTIFLGGVDFGVRQMSATQVETSFTRQFTGGTLVPIEIRFVPRDGARFSLRWRYPSSTDTSLLVNPRQLLRPVVVGGTTPLAVTWTTDVISRFSTVVIPTYLVRDEWAIFFVEPRDKFGNPGAVATSCQQSGTFPECLFEITSTPVGALVGTTPVISHLADNRFQIDLKPTEFHAMQIFIKLRDQDTNNYDLVGSPFSFVVK